MWRPTLAQRQSIIGVANPAYRFELPQSAGEAVMASDSDLVWSYEELAVQVPLEKEILVS